MQPRKTPSICHGHSTRKPLSHREIDSNYEALLTAALTGFTWSSVGLVEVGFVSLQRCRITRHAEGY